MTRAKKWLFAALGGLFFTIGFIGIFLPVLPTAPFMLLAVWGFSRSSTRLHDMIYDHPRLGRHVRQWKQHGTLPLRAKISAISVMSLSAAYLIIFSAAPAGMIVIALIVVMGGALYLITRPSAHSGGF